MSRCDRLLAAPRTFGPSRWLAAVTLAAAWTSLACSSAPRAGVQGLDPGIRGERRMERLERRLEGNRADEQLAALYKVPRRSRASLDPERGAPALRPFAAVPPSPAAGPGAQEVCGASFCAGVARRSLDPGAFDLPPRPTKRLLRSLSRESRPPLSGYGGRVAPFGALLLRLFFPRQYYAHLFRQSAGTLDEDAVNNAKALVLLDAHGSKVVWIKMDILGAFQDIRSEVLRRLPGRGVSGVHDGNLLLHGTHTHAGLGAVNPRKLFQVATVDLFSEPVFEALVEKVVEAVVEAEARLEPARLATGSTEAAGITVNRRDTCSEEGDPPNSEPDTEVGLIRIDRAGGEALATVINFAVHGTSLPHENLLYSPDNMGYAERFVERQVGGMALFFNGAEGDVAPVELGSPAESAVRVGETLGQFVATAHAGLAPSDEVRLSSTYCQLDDPKVVPDFPRPCPRQVDHFQLRPLKFIERSRTPGCYRGRGVTGWAISVRTEKDPPLLEREGVVLGAFRIDVGSGTEAKSVVVVTLPGEPITDVGLGIKSAVRRDHGFDHAWIFGLSNAHMSYIVTEEEYVQGGYEAASNVFGPSAGEVFTENALHLVEGLVE